jgi:hypothetical protein
MAPVLMFFMWLIQGAPAAPEAVSSERARAAFEHVRQLAGEWDQASTKGWTGMTRTQVIAGGTAVLMTSNVGPHPAADETMATVFYLDGDRLLLTHYCVAKNQPRLVATSISADGRRIEFAFLDGTNMRSRDAGHMNRAVFTIESADRYRSRWTFSQRGQEQWMEEIVGTRRR